MLDLSGRPVWLYAEDALQQHIHSMLSLWLTTWFLDTTRGVDWVRVFRGEFDKVEIIGNLIRALKRSPWITKVVDISLQRDGHVLNIVYTVEADKFTITGVVPLGQQSEGPGGATAYGEGEYGVGVYG